MRQTDPLPGMAKCMEKTIYPNQKRASFSRITYPCCVYLENGKCTLNDCIKNFRREENEIGQDYQ